MFISEKFYLNNVHNSSMGVILIKLDTNVLSDYGVSYNIEIEKESTSNNFNHYSVSGESIDDMVLNMCLINNRHEPQIWTKEAVEVLYDYLLTDEFVPFMSEDDLDIIYYVKAKKIVKKFNLKRQGYLEVTFQLYSNHAYRRDIKKISVETEKSVKIRNVSNISNEFYHPIVEIENLGDENTSIIIENTSIPNSTPFEIRGLKNKECITIDNLLCTVANSEGENRFSLCNRKWFKLKKHENIIKISGHCNAKIKSEFPIVR